jgi:ClpP class serine protease
MRDYPHVMGRIFNRPLLIADWKMHAILAGLAPQLGLVPPKHQAWDDDLRPSPFPNVPGARRDKREYAVTDRGIAVIPVEGTLVHAAATASAPSGMTSYQDLLTYVKEARVDKGVRRILVDGDTPGGEASDSAYELAEEIRITNSVKPVWGVSDEMALSAGYLLLSGCSRLFVPKGGYLGSIGSYCVVLDQTEYDKKLGLKWTFIYSGDYKIDGNPHLGASARLLEKLQADIAQTNLRFQQAVVAGRPQLTMEHVAGLKADWFLGEEAVRLGLADGIGSFSQVLDAISQF